EIVLNQKNAQTDPADASLDAIKQYYLQQNILSQALSGFSTEQTLQTYIPAITVQDLIKGGRDSITMAINNAAGATSGDNWYDFGFNNVAPIGTGPLAQGNFGPLRSGFMEVEYLEIVDVFGQRMQLLTDTHTSDGSLQVIPCMNFAPQSTDTINTGKIYLPPRILAPSRLWFRWLSADFTPDVPGIDSDFVETNTHPATSPVCGWILPNHLDNNLFFYDSTGLPIGSFGIEHNQLVYRTRPGNLNNQQDDLSIDIGTPKAPIVNPNLAQFMWYVKGQNAGFLQDWMQAILNSDTFINPANYAQNNGLAVLVGRPLALTRAVLNMETSGNVLPLSQADTDADAPYPSDINNNNYIYKNRMATSGAKLENVQFPVRLGDLANLDDGLVGYLIESGSSDTPYTTLYAPAASGSGKNNVVQPTSTTVQLTLNATTPITLTLLVDPRAGVHATTGVLPVANLQIPMDQYGQAMRSMAMTFFTHPMLQGAQGLVVPLPQESGLAWNWIFPDAEYPISLQANAANQNANWGFTPQTVLEGWLQLSEAPTSTSGTKN
ncbi:TPA: hypothetical protein DDW35_11310, partial [Candidatus Sumerlaeota bacterium]|nr:hypothetical protein [Candidatus Sumerlaeota bacterium]